MNRKKSITVEMDVMRFGTQIPVVIGADPSFVLTKKQRWKAELNFKFISTEYDGAMEGTIDIVTDEAMLFAELIKRARIELLKVQNEEGDHCGLSDEPSAAYIKATLIPRDKKTTTGR